MTNQGAVFEGDHYPIETTLYVPSTNKSQQVITASEQAKRVMLVRKWLADNFGGYTSVKAMGGYTMSEGEQAGAVISEPVFKVTAFTDETKFTQFKEALTEQVKEWGKEWGQEKMGVEYEGDYFMIPTLKEAKAVQANAPVAFGGEEEVQMQGDEQAPEDAEEQQEVPEEQEQEQMPLVQEPVQAQAEPEPEEEHLPTNAEVKAQIKEEGRQMLEAHDDKFRAELKQKELKAVQMTKVPKLGSLGSGWHEEPVSHSYASKFGKAPAKVRGR